MPDSLTYYQREVTVIRDTPGGVHGVDFQWTWEENAGAPPARPFTSAQPSGNNLDRLIQQLRDEIAAVRAVAEEALAKSSRSQAPAENVVKCGDSIGLRTKKSGDVVVAHDGGGGDLDARPTAGNPHKRVGLWETLVVERGE